MTQSPGSADRATGPAVKFTQLFLGSLEDLPLLFGKLPARSVDVEVEHGHGGPKSGALASITVFGGALEREGNPFGIIPGEDAWLEIEGVAGFGDLLGPAFGRVLGHKVQIPPVGATPG